jgi:hypothetical protein
MPPGGPVDTEAPQIVKIIPDSAKTGTTPPEVVFRFNEVVSERPSGAPSLSSLFLISPRDGEPRVEWHRSAISVKPRRGWRKNTAYTVTLLPGLSDLRGNTRNTGAVTQFATGASIPTGRISGSIFNWAEGRFLPRALVEARPRTDTTLVYVTTSDSTGAFTLGTLPPGAYQLRGIADENNNKGLDPREAFDSLTVTLIDTARTDIYAFVHDSVGARISGVTVTDSVTIDIAFDNPIAPTPLLTAASIKVKASDSTEIPVVSVSPPAQDTAGIGARKFARPIPPRVLTVKLGRPLRPRTDYRVSVIGVRNLTGIVKSSDKVINIPAPAPPPAAAPTTGSPVSPPAGTPIKR